MRLTSAWLWAGFLLLVQLGAMVADAADAQKKADPADEEPITLTLDGDRVTYSADRKRATVSGNARIWVRMPNFGDGATLVEADEIIADLEKGTIQVPGQARLLVGPALMVGSGLSIDAPAREFSLKDTEGYGAIPPLEGSRYTEPAKVYFKGKGVVKQGDITNILHARMTTCPKDKPDFAIIAKRIKYDPANGRVIIYGAKLRLYGMTIPLIPWIKTGIGGSGSGEPYALGMPGYNRLDGINVPFAVRMTPVGDAYNAAIRGSVTAKSGVIGRAFVEHERGRWDFEVGVARRLRMVDDVTDAIAVDQFPELGAVYWFTPRQGCDNELKLDLEGGYYRERLERLNGTRVNRPRVDAWRSHAELTYTANSCSYRNREGDWYGAVARISNYSTDETYTDLEAFAGLGGPITDNLRGDVTLRHHFVGGSTPFLFDDVDIQTELATGLEWDVNDRWKLDGWTRYDLDEGDMKDYEVGVSYRAGCLTWGLYYRDVNNGIGLRLDLTGITGGTAPLGQRSRLEKQMEARGLSVTPMASRPGGRLKIEGNKVAPAPAAPARPQAPAEPKETQ